MDGYPIVVAFDGSETAEAALCWALDEGVRRRTSVCIAHVLDPECRIGEPGMAGSDDRRRAAEATVERMAREAEDWGQLGITVSGTVLDGPVARALCERSRRASMLVLGDRGVGGFPGQRIGSVSLAVAAHADCPVVVVRGVPHASSRPIAVGVDDAPEARLAVGFAFQEAAARGVSVLAVRGWSVPAELRAIDEDWVQPALVEQERAEQRVLITGLSSWRDRFPMVAVERRLVPVTATHALTIASRDAQLVVVGDRGSGGFAGLRLGSVAEQVLQHSLCAVMVVRGSLAPAVLRSAAGYLAEPALAAAPGRSGSPDTFDVVGGRIGHGAHPGT